MSFYRIIPPHPPLTSPVSPLFEGGERGGGLKGGKGGVEILYQVVGKGTEIMSELKEGDTLDILAPLGRGFSIPEKMERAILVAGGIGVAPMVALAEEMRCNDPSTGWVPQDARCKINVFIGGKTKDDILCIEDFEKIGADVHVATEDGSMGKKGTCVDLFKEFVTDSQLSIVNRQSSIIFSCGPQGMLKAVANIARNKNMPCQVSLDKRMACGTGACLGCVVKVRSKESGVRSQKSISQLPPLNSQLYKCVCTDGPVFDIMEINWEEM